MINPKLSYEALDAKLEPLTTDELVALLDSPSIKIGDTASSLLFRRDALDSIYDAIRDQRLRTKLGRIRAINTLLMPERNYPKSFDACLLLLHDRSREVVGLALFGLTLWSDTRCLPALERLRDGPNREKVSLAIKAIQAGDYRIYTPHFNDNGRWKNSQSNVA